MGDFEDGGDHDFQEMQLGGPQDEVDLEFFGIGGGGGTTHESASHMDRGKITNIGKYHTEMGERFKPKIQQMMVCFDLGVAVPLENTSARVRIFEFTPDKIVYGVLHLPRPIAKVRVTAGGKCTILKVKSYDDAVRAAKKTCKLFRKIGIPAKVTNFRIANIVAVTDLKLPIRLLDLHKKHKHWCTYEPEIFPALRMNMLNPKCTVSVFVNGKMTIVGARRESSLALAISRLFPIIRPFMGNADGSSEALIKKILADSVGETKEVENYKEEFDSEDEANYEAAAPVQHDVVRAPATAARTSGGGNAPATQIDVNVMDAVPVKIEIEDEESEGGKENGGKKDADDEPFAGILTTEYDHNENEDFDLGMN